MLYGENFYVDSEIDSTGTFLQGVLWATREEISKAFGEPIHYPLGDKITTEWIIQFDSGDIATVYDWKRYDSGRPGFTERYDWHIGGSAHSVCDLVERAVHRAKTSVIK